MKPAVEAAGREVYLCHFPGPGIARDTIPITTVGVIFPRLSLIRPNTVIIGKITFTRKFNLKLFLELEKCSPLFRVAQMSIRNCKHVLKIKSEKEEKRKSSMNGIHFLGTFLLLEYQ